MKTICLLAPLLFIALHLNSQDVEIQIVPEVLGPFVHYHVKVGGFENMVGAQGTFEWDPDSIDFFEVSYIGIPGMNSNNFNLTQADSGRLFYLWFGVGSGASLEACETLFTFRFRILEGVAELRQRPDAALPVEFTNSDFQQVGVTTFMVEECVYSSVADISGLTEKVRIFPNPVRAGDPVYLKFDEVKSIHSAEVIDPLGRTFSLPFIYTSDVIELKLPAHLPTGLYRLRINQSATSSGNLLVVD